MTAIHARPGRPPVANARAIDAAGFADAVIALRFARTWLPFGGTDCTEVYLQFGLTPAQFSGRLDRALRWPAAINRVGLCADDCRRLQSETQRLTTVHWPLECPGGGGI